MLSEKDQGKNIREAKKFLEYWKAKGKIEFSQSVYIFPCELRLRFKTADARTHDMDCTSKAHIYVESNELYKIYIEENEWFKDPFVHLEYWPSYQAYRMSSDNTLRVSGEAKYKNYKDYRLNILPTG